MAFPVVKTADTKSGEVSSNSTSWSLTYPTNLASGDLILLVASIDGQGVPSLPEGWNRAGRRLSVFSAVTQVIAAKISDGTETGSFTLSPGANEQGSWHVFRITGWYGSGLFADSTTSPFSLGQLDGNGISVSRGPIDSTEISSWDGTSPDPPSLNPANWDAEDTLWIAACASDHGNTTYTGFPTNYDAYTDIPQESGGSNGAAQGIAFRELNASSEDPGAFTTDASEQYFPSVIAIRPAAAVPFRPRISFFIDGA